MNPVVKKFENRRRCIINTNSGQFVHIFGDQVTAVVQNRPAPSNGGRLWAEFRGSPPPLDFDPLTLSAGQRQAILDLVPTYFRHQQEIVETTIQETLRKIDSCKAALSKLKAGFSPPGNMPNEGALVWHYNSEAPYKDDPASWTPTHNPSGDQIENTKRQWAAERLQQWCENRISREEAYLRDFRKNLRTIKNRAGDTYAWVDVHTDTVKTVTITPV